MTAFARIAALGLVTGLGLGLGGQALSPFHVPGHELVLVFCVVAAFVQLHLAAAAWRWTEGPHRLESALGTALVGVVTLAVGAHGVAAAGASWRDGCVLSGTGLFWWITWVPLGALATVFGVALARAGRGFWVRTLVFVALVALSLGHDLLQARLGVHVVDPLLGCTLGLDQRAGTELPTVHVLQRGWLMAVAAAAGAGLVWWARRTSPAAWLAGWTAAGVLVATVGWGSRLGVGFDRRALHAQLDGVASGPHLRVRFSSRGDVRFRVDAVVREIEWQLHRFSTAWEVPLDGVVIDVLLFDDREHLQRVTGASSAHARDHFIAAPLADVFDSTMPHEVVHALDLEAGARWYDLLRSRGIVEGSAVAWADDLWTRDQAHQMVASAAAADRVPSARRLLSFFGFWRTNEAVAYQASGSFVGWLVRTEGAAKWKRLLATEDPEGVYGRSLDELDGAWRTWLAALPIAPEQALRARHGFNPARYPSALDRRCPKLGTWTPEPAREARWAANARDPGHALEIYRGLIVSDPEDTETWTLASVRALMDLERYDEALATLRDLPPTDDDALWLTRLDSELVAVAALGQVEGLAQVLDRRLALDEDPALAALRRLLDDPELAPELPSLVHDKGSYTRRYGLAVQLDAWAEAWPERADDLAVVRQAWGPSVRAWAVYGLSAEDRRVVHELLDRVEARPATCDAVAGIAGLGQAVVQIGDCALARAVSELVGRHCTDPDILWELSRLQARLAWEAVPEEGIAKACVP